MKCSDGYVFFICNNLSFFSSLKLCNLQNRQFRKYPLSQTVKNKVSLITILYSIGSCLKLPKAIKA